MYTPCRLSCRGAICSVYLFWVRQSNPEKQLRIRKSQARLCSPYFCAYPGVCEEGDHCVLHCHTEAHFLSVVWDLGHRFLSNARNNHACLSSANCQVPRVLLSPSSPTGELVQGPAQHHCSNHARPCSQPSQPLCPRTRGGAHSWFTGWEAACGSPLCPDTPDPSRHEKKGEWGCLLQGGSLKWARQ